MSEDTLTRTLQAYQRLVEIARDLASTLDLDTLLKRIVHLAAELNDAEEASILLYDSKKQHLYFQASTDQKNASEMQGIIVPTESIAGWVALNRQPVIVADVLKDNRFFRNIDQLLKFKTRSIVAVPMITKDKLIGVLEVINKRSQSFTPLDQEVLMVLAGQAAVGIENTRLFHQSDLISELVHELRTPLTSINTITYILQRQGIAEQQRIALAQTVQNEATRLNEMATSFLDLARLESGRSEFRITSFDPAQLLNECFEIVQPRAQERELEIAMEIAPGLPEMAADRDKMKQVLLNLLNNAVKYNRPKGTIHIRLCAIEDQIKFNIQDSGRGIPDDMLPRVFEKFFRAQPNDPSTPGTGLGLYICKKIVENHGGQIQVHSTEDVGTTFEFSIPISPS